MASPFEQAEKQYCGKDEHLVSVGRLDDYTVLYKCFSKDGIENKTVCPGSYIGIYRSEIGCAEFK